MEETFPCRMCGREVFVAELPRRALPEGRSEPVYLQFDVATTDVGTRFIATGTRRPVYVTTDGAGHPPHWPTCAHLGRFDLVWMRRFPWGHTVPPVFGP
jgi:hypothetical protein